MIFPRLMRPHHDKERSGNIKFLDHFLHAPTIQIPTVNHDNNQHSFNENLRIANLWDGIETMAVLLTMN